MKVIVTAPRGKMGRLIIGEAMNRKEVELVGALGHRGRTYMGKDAGLVAGTGQKAGVLCYSDIEEIIEACDVVVDFSVRELSMKVLEVCLRHNKSVLCGTTGFDEREEEAFSSASKNIPVLKASNTSYMVNVLREMMRVGAEALGVTVKVDILDFHDENKLDAPSGTAKDFGETILEAGKMNPEQLDFHSVRAGDISSTHTVYFGGMGERIELTHRCYDWTPLAKGALDGALFLYCQDPGMYGMKDVINHQRGTV